MQDVFRLIQRRPVDIFAKKKTIGIRNKTDVYKELLEARTSDRPASRAQEIVQKLIDESQIVSKNEGLTFADAYTDFFASIDLTQDDITKAKLNKQIETSFGKKLNTLSREKKILGDYDLVFDYLMGLKLSAELQEKIEFNPANYLKLLHYIIVSGKVDSVNGSVYFDETFIILPKEIFPFPSLLHETYGNADAVDHDKKREQDLKEIESLKKKLYERDTILKEISFLPVEDTKIVEEEKSDDSEDEEKREDPARELKLDPEYKLLVERVKILSQEKGIRLRRKSSQASIKKFGGQLLLSDDKIQRLSTEANQYFKASRIDVKKLPLPHISQRIESEINMLSGKLEPLVVKYARVANITGQSSHNQMAHHSSAYQVKRPRPLSKLEGCSIGDLLVVKEQIKCYEAGEVAHIENILKGEAKKREHRRLKRTEETFIIETEESSTEEREHESTERFELQKTSSKVIEEDEKFKAGVNVKAKYGPFVEVEANVGYEQGSNTKTSQSSASKYSKDVTDRAKSIITNKVRTEQISKIIIETEDKNSHELNNIGGDKHTVGIYQWVDKIMEAQVYKYGVRTLCDFMIPEPAAFYIYSQMNKPILNQPPTPPPAFNISAADITRWSYKSYAAIYKAEGVGPPPEQWKTVSEAYEVKAEDDTQLSKTGKLVAPSGYKISNVTAYAAIIHDEGDDFDFAFGIGAHFKSGLGVHSVSTNSNGEVGISMVGRDVELFIANAHGSCELTTQKYEKWQLETFDKLLSAHQALKEQYEEALAQSEVSEGIEIKGRNPAKNRKLEENELKKSCLSVFTGQNFDGINAIQFSPEGYPEVNTAIGPLIGKYVRFFEQAYEWEQMMYLFYPYFWGRKPQWVNLINYEDVDPKFESFLQAGYARVVVPVRPGFEIALQHYLDTGVIWNGQPLPEVGSDMYVSIIQEIKERQDAPLGEEPYGESWDVRLPTSLVRVKDSSTLPKWEKNEEGEWEPVVEENPEISGPSPAPIVEP